MSSKEWNVPGLQMSYARQQHQNPRMIMLEYSGEITVGLANKAVGRVTHLVSATVTNRYIYLNAKRPITDKASALSLTDSFAHELESLLTERDRKVAKAKARKSARRSNRYRNAAPATR